jgi:beta-galactosidase
MINGKLPKIWYGGDYNPEQWEEDVWDEDVRMFKLAGIDVATLNVFSWALNQPDENTYRFEWLDEQMDRLYLRVDYYGRKRAFGGRHNSCPNSPTCRLPVR